MHGYKTNLQDAIRQVFNKKNALKKQLAVNKTTKFVWTTGVLKYTINPKQNTI